MNGKMIRSAPLTLLVVATFTLMFPSGPMAKEISSHLRSESTVVASRQASGVYDAQCRGASKEKIVQFYMASSDVRHPLRCGTANFGYRHIRDRHGFIESTDRYIRETLAAPTKFELQGPTAARYEKEFVFGAGTIFTFRVVVDHKPYAGSHLGVVTAYISE